MYSNAFRIGFVVTLSFLLIFSTITFTLGYFPPPEGPKAPEYPTYESSQLSQPLMNNSQQQKMPGQTLTPGIPPSVQYTDPYQEKINKYNESKKLYDQQQKTFVKNKIIPYLRNVLVGWILAVIIFEILGLVFSKLGLDILGGGYAFSGVWSAVFGPFGGLLWFISSWVYALSGKSNQEFSTDPILQAVSLTSLFGVIVLTVFGLIFSGRFRLNMPRLTPSPSQNPYPQEPPLVVPDSGPPNPYGNR